MKICSKCKEEKDESEFCKDKSRKDGLRNNCIVCSSIISKKHREENKEKIKEDKKEYYQEHKEEISEKGKIYREENKEKIKENECHQEHTKEKIDDKIRKCTTCKKEKDISKFYKKKSGKIRMPCIECTLASCKRYRDNNKETVAATGKRYRKNNKEKERQRHVKYERENAEKISIRKQKRYEKYKDEVLSNQREYYRENKSKISKRISAYKKRRREVDEQFRVTELLRRRLADAYKQFSTTGKIMKSKDLGIDYEAIFKHIGLCPGEREDYHIHHIIPLCSFNFDDPEQVRLAFAPENHQWLTKEENVKRSAEDRKLSIHKNKKGESNGKK